MAYNGWTNYETWNVALWLDNDEGTYRMRQEWAQDAWDKAEYSSGKDRAADAASILADTIKAWIEDNNPLANELSSVYSDLLSAAISEVNWHEIAENWIEEVDKEEEDADEDEDPQTHASDDVPFGNG